MLRRLMVLLTVLGMTVGFGQNLVLNGDFEAWTANAPDSWTTIETGITVSAEDNPAFFHGGSWSMKTDVTTGDQGSTDFRQSLDVVADETYDISVWVYHADNEVQARLYVETYRGYSDNSIVGAWQEMTYSYTATATGSIEVGLRFYDQADFDGSSTVYIDDYTMVVGVPPEPTIYTITEIQTPDEGGDASQHSGEFIETRGIVTAIGGYFYFIQDGEGDYSGVYVYNSPGDLALGDDITIIGNVAEYNGLTQISDVSTTTIHSSGNTLPAARVLTTGAVASELNEGMLVKTAGPCTAVSAAPGSDRWLFQLDDGSGAAFADDGIFTPTTTVGTTYEITGALTYYYGNFSVLTRDAADVVEVIVEPEVDLTGRWTLAPIAGALMVGPNPNDGSWWSNSEGDVAGRACIFDDEFVFNADGSFENVLGDETWVEAWQGVAEGCGAPVAPHDGSATATWFYDVAADTIIIEGMGAYLGIPKAFTGGELSAPGDAPASITYSITLSEDNQTMVLVISTGGGYWTFTLAKVQPVPTGVWVLAPEPGAMIVGPNATDVWWQNSADDVVGRACIFDDEYVFGSDGSFSNVLGTETWLETWQGAAADGCGAPVAPHDGTVEATWTYDETAGTLTIDGTGAYLGIAKPFNGGEHTSPADAPASITYDVVLSDNNMTMNLTLNYGVGIWRFKLIDINSVPVEIPAPLVAAPVPTVSADSVISIYSDSYANLAETNFNPNWGQSTAVTVDHVVAESNVLFYQYLNYQGTNLGGADGVDQDFTVAEYLHVDFWTPHADTLNFFLISRTTGEQAYVLTSTMEAWMSVDIPMTHFTDLGLGLSDIFQFKVDGGDGSTIVYFDNIYFGGVTPAEVAVPLVAAPTPTAHADSVFSIYSDTYEDLAGTNFNPNWGQLTVVTVDSVVAESNVLLYENLNYQGTNLGSADGADQDFSGYEALHLDFWTPNADTLYFFLISRTTGEQAYMLPVTTEEWVSVDIPLTHFTDLGLGLSDIFQFKVDGGDGSTIVYFDNWYFLTGGSIIEPPVMDITGSWQMAPMAGALMVGPNPNDGSWWANSAGDVDLRACFFDDEYVFSADGTFMNVLGDETWVEAWQGVAADGCGAPVAPHDASNAATWTMDATAGTVTLNGIGAYLGIPKAYTGGELSTPGDAPESITYEITVSDDNQTMVLVISTGGGYWTFTLARPAVAPTGVWVMAPEAGALMVGPNPNDGSWWANSADDVALRTCFFDDEYVFNADGTFQNVLGDATWVEAWQGVAADGCSAPVAPHDGSVAATWTYDETAGTITLDGTGAYLGIPKAITGGELSTPGDAPESITYEITLSDNDMTMTLVISTGGGYWTFKLIDINSVVVPVPVPLVAAPTPTAPADSVISIYSDAYSNLAETNFNPNWGQSTVVTVDTMVAESNVLLYEYLNYQGTNLGGADGVAQDLTVAEYIHIDFWTPNATTLNFFLISATTGEQAYSLPVTTEEWVSVDIPLTHFTDLGLGISDIFQFKVDGGDGNTIVYFDNVYFGGVAPVSIAGLNLPESFAIHQNYPNPFNPSTTIRFDMPHTSNVKIVLFDVQGREVAELVNEEFTAGQYQTVWNGLNAQGTAMPAGIYFARMITSSYASTVKMLLVK